MTLTKSQKEVLRKLHKQKGLSEKAWESKVFAQLFETLLSGKKSYLSQAVLDAQGQKELEDQLKNLEVLSDSNDNEQ